MKLYKKLLCLTLALVMSFGFMTMGAGAVFTDDSDINSIHKEAINMCIALKAIDGYPDGSFKPVGNVTRAEMSKMICIVLNGGVVPTTATKSSPTFTDIEGNWAEGFIEYCFTKGIVAGIGNDLFNPEGNVTASEAAKMLLVSLGYNAQVEGYVGPSWELNVNVQANQDGIYKNLTNVVTNEPLTRENAAQMIWNALQANVITKSSSIDRADGSITDIYTKNLVDDLLFVMYNGEIIEDTLFDFSWNEKDHDWTYTVGNVQVKSADDYTALVGQKVKTVYDMNTIGNIKDAYGIFAVDSQVLFKGIVGDLPNIKPVNTDVKFNNTIYRFDNNMTADVLPVFESSTIAYDAFTADTLNKLAGQINGENISTYDSLTFQAIDYDGNGKIDFITVTPISIAKITYVNNTKFRTGNAVFGDLKAAEWTKEDVVINGNIVKDDYVAVVAAPYSTNDTTEFTKLDIISGKITIKDGSKVTIGGEVYILDDSYNQDVKAGTILKDAPVYNNYIFAGEVTGNFNVSDYVIAINSNAGAFSDSVKLLFSDGTKKIVDLDVKVLSANEIVPGQLYTYSINRDNEYQLTPASDYNTGFNYSNGTGTKGADILTFDRISNSSNKVGYIDNYKIADDAVIFINYNNNSYKIITGANMKAMNMNQFTGSYVLATNNSSTGVGEVNMAYVSTSAETIKNNNSQYGYIVKIVEAQNDNKEDIYIITLLTASGVVELETVELDNTLRNQLVDSNMIIEYTVDENNHIDGVEQSVMIMIPIAGKSTDALWFNDGSHHEFDKNAVIVLINESDVEAIDVGSVDDINIAEEPDGYPLPNAFVMFNDDRDIVFVAYDVNNGI